MVEHKRKGRHTTTTTEDRVGQDSHRQRSTEVQRKEMAPLTEVVQKSLGKRYHFNQAMMIV
jgi:hypothetical protein